MTHAKSNAIPEDLTQKMKDHFRKLISGDYGLFQTYWLYGVCVSVLLTIISSVLLGIEGLGVREQKLTWQFSMVLFAIHTAYRIPWTIGLYRSSLTYNGAVAWSYLARLSLLWIWANEIKTWLTIAGVEL